MGSMKEKLLLPVLVLLSSTVFAVEPSERVPIPKNQPGSAYPGASRFNPLAGKAILHRMNSVTPEKNLWESKGAGEHISVVIGTDDRVKIPNPEQIPSKSPISKVYIAWGSNLFICSGTLISPRHLLTAAHCVYDPSDGWVSGFQAVPAMSGTNQPFGTASATSIRAYSGWINNGDTNYDIALVTLDSDIGTKAGNLQIANVNFPNTNPATIAGYPGDLEGGNYMYYATGPIETFTDTLLTYTIDTAGGQSGSSITMQDTQVVGVHTSGTSQFNIGTRINAQKFQDLTNWITEDNNP